MRLPLERDVPAGAAITIVALVLLASVVTGREDSIVPAAAVDPIPASRTAAVAVEDLDLEVLKRTRNENVPQDLFAPRVPVQPPSPAAAVNPKPPPPSAPPLPYKYLGRMVDSGKAIVFLERNQNSVSAVAGDTLDNTYQVENIAESAVHFVYLPLGTKQVLGIPAPQ